MRQVSSLPRQKVENVSGKCGAHEIAEAGVIIFMFRTLNYPYASFQIVSNPSSAVPRGPGRWLLYIFHLVPQCAQAYLFSSLLTLHILCAHSFLIFE